MPGLPARIAQIWTPEPIETTRFGVGAAATVRRWSERTREPFPWARMAPIWNLGKSVAN